ncbi:MAG: 4-hydroxy-tetrahydrodipicolinate reductase [Candidatus Dormibacterales bacterium]
MIQICIAGITGWTGAAIARAVDKADDLVLTSGVCRSPVGSSLSGALDVKATGLIHSSVPDALSASRFDVLIDYTSATAVKENVWAAVRAGVHVVVGSSGLTAADYQELDVLARQKGVGVIAAGNFSLMAAILRHSARAAARHLNHWEIIDYASDTKPDVPSGTARDLAETLAEVHMPRAALSRAELIGPVEAVGAQVAGSRVHSVRLPGFVVSTEIVFGAPGERLILRHDPGSSPAPYVAGTLMAVRNVASMVGVRRGLESLLFASPET